MAGRIRMCRDDPEGNRIEIHTFGLVDGTAPRDGVVHRKGNNIYPVAFGSILMALWMRYLII